MVERLDLKALFRAPSSNQRVWVNELHLLLHPYVSAWHDDLDLNPAAERRGDAH